jgi:hypothetical protein
MMERFGFIDRFFAGKRFEVIKNGYFRAVYTLPSPVRRLRSGNGSYLPNVEGTGVTYLVPMKDRLLPNPRPPRSPNPAA